MRVVDLLFRYATPGTVVVDLTADRSELAGAANHTDLGLPYEREPRGTLDAPRSLVMHTVLETTDPSPFARARPTSEVVHVVFVEQLDALVEYGVLADAAEREQELLGVHQVRHKIGRFAAVFAHVTDPARITQLRLVNEYRYTKLRVDELAAVAAERDVEVTKLRARVTMEDADRAELAKLRREVQWHKKRGESLERKLANMVKRLESARTSVGFRIGRATTLAIKGGAKNITKVPRRWLDGFRGKDEILEQARDELAQAKPIGGTSAPVEATAIELEMYQLGRPAPPPSRTGIAGIASPRFAAELAACVPFTQLSPHAWLAQLVSLPAYVLVTSDGLAPDGAWSSGGTLGGRDGDSVLRDLLVWCRERGVPTVYWDTIGGVEVRGAQFDARFSIAPSMAAGGDAELLAPAIEPTVWKPDAADASVPVHALYSGVYDGRASNTELNGALRAATSHGLQILDPYFRLEGAFAEMVRFPDSLTELTRRRPSTSDECAAMSKAGVVIAAPPAGDGDVPSWQLLRGLASGAHVLACGRAPAAFADAVEAATDDASAQAALGRLFARARRDAAWRSAYEHVLSNYALRDRLDTIATRVRVAPVVGRAGGTP